MTVLVAHLSLAKELTLHCGQSGLLAPYTVSSEARLVVPGSAHITERVRLSH